MSENESMPTAGDWTTKCSSASLEVTSASFEDYSIPEWARVELPPANETFDVNAAIVCECVLPSHSSYSQSASRTRQRRQMVKIPDHHGHCHRLLSVWGVRHLHTALALETGMASPTRFADAQDDYQDAKREQVMA